MDTNELQRIIDRYRRELFDFAKRSEMKNMPGNQESVMSPLTYAAFMEGNPKNGSLKVQIYTAQGAYPVPNAQVTVSKSFVDGIQVFYKGVSDEDGIVEIDNLPAPDKKASLDEYDTLPTYSNYDIEILHPDYAPVRYHNVQVFDGNKSVQPVEMVPLGENSPSRREEQK